MSAAVHTLSLGIQGVRFQIMTWTRDAGASIRSRGTPDNRSRIPSHRRHAHVQQTQALLARATCVHLATQVSRDAPNGHNARSKSNHTLYLIILQEHLLTPSCTRLLSASLTCIYTRLARSGHVTRTRAPLRLIGVRTCLPRPLDVYVPGSASE